MNMPLRPFKFRKTDRVTLFGQEVTDHAFEAGSHRFRLEDQWGGVQHKTYSNEEVTLFLLREELLVDRDYYKYSRAVDRQLFGQQDVTDLPAAVRRSIWRKHALCLDMLDLIATKGMRRTEAGISAFWRILSKADEARQRLAATGAIKKHSEQLVRLLPHPRTLLGLLRKLEKANWNPMCFARKPRAPSASEAVEEVDEEALHHAQAILEVGIRAYADPRRPTKGWVVTRTLDAFDDANRARAERGDPRLRVPSRRSVYRAIAALDPFWVCAQREGVGVALKRFGSTIGGLPVEKMLPLDRIEIDEWRVHAITLAVASGTWDRMTPKQRKMVARRRLWLVAAIDVATRCIVGMVLTDQPHAGAGLDVLRMVTVDKTKLAEGVGAKTPWSMHGRFREVACDFGSAFVSDEFRNGVHVMRGAKMHPILRRPDQRGHGERIWRTIGTKLMPRLPGHTGGSIAERGDYDAGAMAAITDDRLWSLLVNHVVDEYHNEPHRGLGGETPLQAWQRLTQDPKFDHDEVLPAERRLAFGHRFDDGKIGQEGLVEFGVVYTSDAVREHRAFGRSPDVEFLVDPCNIGAISVRLDGQWKTVPALDRSLAGKSLREWKAEQEHRRRLLQSEQQQGREIARQARDRTEALIQEAIASHGADMPHYTRESISRIRNDMLATLSRGAATSHPVAAGDDPLAQAVPVAQASQRSVPPPPGADEDQIGGSRIVEAD